MVRLAVNEPVGVVEIDEGEVVSETPSNFTDVIVDDGEKPVPETEMTSPTDPEVSLRVMRALLLAPTVTLTAFEGEP